MSIIVPFRALRPRKEYVAAVASLPYDVVSWDEAREIAAGNAMSYLHVEKSEIDLSKEIPALDPSIYDRAKENLAGMIASGILFQEGKACLYIYAQEMNGFRQYGIVGGVSVGEYERGIIKKHELTRADKELDRIRHLDRVNAQTGPVFVTYRQRQAIDHLVEAVVKKDPEYDFVTEDGISHTVWVVEDEKTMAALAREFNEVERLYIADGHHRAAAAAAVARMRRQGKANGRDAEYEHIMAVLFPHNQLKVMDYNRVVKDLHGLQAGEFLEKCRRDFIVLNAHQEKAPRRRRAFGMYLAGRWFRLTVRENAEDQKDPLGRLDVTILQERLLDPVLGIHDPRTDDRIGFVGGIRGMQELEKLVDSGQYAVAFALYPVTVEQLMDVGDADLIMPPKSTWFEPKLRSGIFTHLLTAL